MKKNNKKINGKVVINFLVLLVIAIGLGFTFKPLLNSLNFGLDLQGGFEVLYQVKSVDDGKVTKDMVTNTYKTIGKRIDVLGVSEPNITVEGDDKIRVQLAGVTDPEKAREILSKAANLTFRDTSDNLLMTAEVLKSGGAKIGQDGNGLPAVALSISDKEEFLRVTKKVSEMEDNRIVIWLDFEDGSDSFAKEEGRCGSLNSSRCLSVASVSQGFASDVIIQGNFKLEEVTNLVELINSGSLPTKLEEISSKSVEASFGANSLEKTFLAGVVGVVGVMLFMTMIYRFAGLISSVGIMIYTFITFGIFWLIGGILTLPGIAALVIGIGMAVDASVLSFARIKDELYEGATLQNAFIKGNKNSFWAIFDSNLTTLLVAIILFIFGESTIKGFATMLIISICVTMLIMVFLTRVLLKSFVKTGYFDDKTNFFIGTKAIQKSKDNNKKAKRPFEKVDFMNGRKWYFAFTIILIIVGALFIGIKGLKLGIDFKGGSSITLTSSQKLDENTLKADIEELKYDFDHIEKVSDTIIMIRVTDTLTKEQVAEAEQYFQDKYEAKTEIGVVSNIVKQELVKNAIISILLASIGIIIYMSFRFAFNYAISGVIAIFVDVFVMIALFSIFRLEVSSIFIAAILSIIGYAINDTIVTFDRIKENIIGKGKIKKEEEFKDVVNKSLRQTFTRSIITTITTLIPVISLIVLGSHEIFNFNIALLFGLVYGVFSSVFIASGIWYQLEKKEIGAPVKKKWYEE
ncbi:MAG: protein translocase subunit SecD [Bacilli bacterium]|nr:protein translocase subunit SecD [Bacilli bacterium]